MTEPTITTERTGHVFRIGLNRPAKRNAFTTGMLGELALAFTAFEDDADAWVALLFAHGEHFTGGLDLAEVGPAIAAGATLFPDGSVNPLDLHGRRRTKPLVCAVQGICFTIGIELMLASDVVVAATGTRFAQMEVRRGIMPFGGATMRMPQSAGWPRAMKWLLTGDEFDAAEALAMGFITEIAPAGTELAVAAALADRIASRAPLAVRATLQNARVAREEGQGAAVLALMATATPLFASDDAREGVMSFLERRDAKFSGR